MPVNNPADVWAETPRTLTDISVEEIVDLPSLDDTYALARPASSGSADTFGAWVEIVADVGTGKRLLDVRIVSTAGLTNGDKAQIQLGEGPGASEAAITMFDLPGFGINISFSVSLFRALTDNARLSVRAKDSVAGAVTYPIAVSIA